MKTTRIVPSEPGGDGFSISNGTKVQFGDGGSPEVWQEINGIKSIDVHFGVDEPVTADVELFVQARTVQCLTSFYAIDPITDERRRISKIVWDDGSEFVC